MPSPLLPLQPEFLQVREKLSLLLFIQQQFVLYLPGSESDAGDTTASGSKSQILTARNGLEFKPAWFTTSIKIHSHYINILCINQQTKLLQNQCLMKEKEKRGCGIPCQRRGQSVKKYQEMEAGETTKVDIFYKSAEEWPCPLTSGQGWEPRCSGVFLSCQCLEAVLPGLIYEDEIGTVFFFNTGSFPEDLLIEVSPFKNHWVKLIYYVACFWFPPGQLLHDVN